MSHITTSKIVIGGDKLDEFAAACRECGVELVRGALQFRAYGGGMNPCVHKVVLPGRKAAYEIGLRRARVNADGSVVEDANGSAYVLAFDEWDGGKGMVHAVGEGCGRLLQAFGRESILATARKTGATVVETRLPDGTVRMTVRPKPMGKVARQW